MADELTGVRRAVQDQRDQIAADWRDKREGGGEQLPLIPVVASELEVLDVQKTDIAHNGGDGKRIGRPKGSRNRRTVETVEYLRSLGYADPLRGLLEIFSRPAKVLADELGCTVMEAFDRQMAAMKDALPFMHQKMPQAVVLDENHQVTIVTMDRSGMRDLLDAADDDDPIKSRGLEILGPVLENDAPDDDGEAA